MKLRTNTNRQNITGRLLPYRYFLLLILLALFFGGCSELKKPASEPFYSETSPPRKQIFRWSNGKMPTSFDPALAGAPPETDVVRAVFEGLTETDPVKLNAVPAMAESWTGSSDNTVWTFELRRDAKWSNGDVVTAGDFVRSWNRVAEMGEAAAHNELLDNIAGIVEVRQKLKQENSERESGESSRPEELISTLKSPVLPRQTETERPSSNGLVRSDDRGRDPIPPPPPLKRPESAEVIKSKPKLSVEAVSEFVLKVSLKKPDAEFPALAAHPIFRPVHAAEQGFGRDGLTSGIITNGAFRISSVGTDGVTLDRSETYWNRENIALERVQFVPAESAEKALEAYRAGEVDAVTNAEFEPLALKLLTPFDDFRRTVHSAVNLYQFNRNNKPFDDIRIREAMTIAITRERLTDDEMDGATKPALAFSPFDNATEAEIKQDPERARQLLADAGYEGGVNFPTVRLLIKRNNIQLRIARSVAEMWKQNLGIDVEIIVVEPEGFEPALKSGQFDLVRKGVVLSVRNETVNMLTIFAHERFLAGDSSGISGTDAPDSTNPAGGKTAKGGPAAGQDPMLPTAPLLLPGASANVDKSLFSENEDLILTEEQALGELRAIPLYFPTSYSLVKPYVLGFSINMLDSPSLQNVRIDNNWQPLRRVN